jgi:hypothetical protein
LSFTVVCEDSFATKEIAKVDSVYSVFAFYIKEFEYLICVEIKVVRKNLTAYLSATLAFGEG